ncbi:response regulator (plasmid) [Kovacikia minuta CCNUW1]|uniref:ATP-binding response regulator n=1 Tax=Kovacikia minuta TaxID=2931930 RepID=UPI001CD00E46|nr:ATP-binding protein [Kovacikia minuta]UBF30577.1 response regulator [Kovacikia minuta CCNUW1]
MISINRNSFGYWATTLTVALSVPLAFLGWQTSLFTANGFIPHGHCYLWKPGLVWMHVASDSLIAIAYIAISATLAYLVYKTRQEIPFHWMFLAFGSFIVACGSTHIMAVWTLWHPTYWLSGALKVLTAIASVTTAIILPCLVPQALALVESAKLSEERRSHLEAANHQLEAMNVQLQQVDQLKTQFFANVSHELRTPLALILGPIEKLLHTETLSQEQRRTLETVDRNACLLLKQVNDLLDVSKLEAGKMALNYTQVDLAQLVRLTAANFDGLAQEKQITLVIDALASLPAQLDATKAQRILLNLLSNAFKFTPSGGRIEVKLSLVDRPSPFVRYQSSLEDGQPPSPSLPGQWIQITISDTGKGIAPEFLPYIFERFSQGEGGTTRRFGGTGLGLAIAKEFVELQGGTIKVSNLPEAGAQFTVELPLMPPAGTRVAPSTIDLEQTEDIAHSLLEELRKVEPLDVPMLEQATEKPLVLVVEDNLEMNQFITTTLASEYRTATATNGQEGLAQAIALQPDLILSDVMMPYLSGDQFVEQVRTHSELETIPVVMLTAKVDDELRVQLLRQGAQDYLMKPFSVEELRARVGNLITVKRVRDLLQQELASQSHDLEVLVQEVSLRRQELQIALNTLQRQAEELAQANRLKDEFLAIVSHELRTPLNAILGWAESLRTRKFNEAITARALETIERNARLQTQLIENLLDISQLLRGKLRLSQSPVDLRGVVKAAVETVQMTATAKAIDLSVEIADVSPESSATNLSNFNVLGDRDRLRQIVENLLLNAIKFTPEGGQVQLKLAQVESREGSSLSPGSPPPVPFQAQIVVSDTGEGIQSEVLPYVFDCFRQADSSTTRKHGGLGLGLAIVQKLVELHQGNIWVESQGEGQGTTFTVCRTITGQLSPSPISILSGGQSFTTPYRRGGKQVQNGRDREPLHPLGFANSARTNEMVLNPRRRFRLFHFFLQDCRSDTT